MQEPRFVLIRSLLATSLIFTITSSAIAEDGPNLLSNGGFESGTGTWSTFGNGFIDSTITHEFSLFSLKMYGCFCSAYNGNGAISDTTIPCTPGGIYRLTGQAYNPSWDSIANTGNWVGIKVEFRDANDVVVGLAEKRLIDALDPSNFVQDEWVPGDILCQAPEAATGFRVVAVMLQADQNDGGATWVDSLGFAESERDSTNVLINGSFDNGVDYNYGFSPYFNGWTEQYGGVFFNDFFVKSPPYAAGLYGNFPDNDGDGNCDPGGVGGLNQRVPNISEGQEVVMNLSAATSTNDSIMGTLNYVNAKIEFFGADIDNPISVASTPVLVGSDSSYEENTWYDAQVSGTAPAGTQSMRIVIQVVQPNCEAGSAYVDDVMVSVDGDPVVESCDGDFNNDGIVNGADFGSLLASWGPCPDCPEDLNSDSVINGADVGLMLSFWGECPDDGDGGGGDPGDNCEEAHGGQGCTNPVCEGIVCGIDPVCCDITWDANCAALAADNCP